MNVLFQYIWDGLQDLAFLTSIQVMPMQLVPETDFEKQSSKESKNNSSFTQCYYYYY